MRPRQVADRAVEVQGGRTVTLYEDGQVVSTWSLVSAASAWRVARAWLLFADVEATLCKEGRP
jgi:hypothetical protein